MLGKYFGNLTAIWKKRSIRRIIKNMGCGVVLAVSNIREQLEFEAVLPASGVKNVGLAAQKKRESNHAIGSSKVELKLSEIKEEPAEGLKAQKVVAAPKKEEKVE